MRDAATRARTREKHDTKTQLKNKSTKPVAHTATGKTKRGRTPNIRRPAPFLFHNHATRLLGVLPISRIHWTKTTHRANTIHFLNSLTHCNHSPSSIASNSACMSRCIPNIE